MMTEAETGIKQLQAKNTRTASYHQKLGRGKEGFYPEFQSMVLLTPGLHTSSLQNFKKINLFKATQLVVLCYGSPRKPTHSSFSPKKNFILVTSRYALQKSTYFEFHQLKNTVEIGFLSLYIHLLYVML